MTCEMEKKKIFIIGGGSLGVLTVITVILLFVFGVFDSWETRKEKARTRYLEALEKVKPELADDIAYKAISDLSKLEYDHTTSMHIRTGLDNVLTAKNEAGYLNFKNLLESLKDYKISEIRAERIKQIESKKNPSEEDFEKFSDDLKIEASLGFLNVLLHRTNYQMFLLDLSDDEKNKFFETAEIEQRSENIRNLMKNNKKASDSIPRSFKNAKKSGTEFIGYIENRKIVHPTYSDALRNIPLCRNRIAELDLLNI